MTNNGIKARQMVALAAVAVIGGCSQPQSAPRSVNSVEPETSGPAVRATTYPLPPGIAKVPQTVGEIDRCVEATIKQDYRFSAQVSFKYRPGSIAAYGEIHNPDRTTEDTTFTIQINGRDPLLPQSMRSNSHVYSQRKDAKLDPRI
jgi:hypothetical protein